MHKLLDMLTGGDRRSIGQANEVVAAVLRDQSLFGVVFGGLASDVALVRMRAADALEKITAKQPEWLQPYKEQLIRQVARSREQEVRWHVAQMFPRVQANQEERAAMVTILLDYLGDKSKIVKTFSLQALADLAEQDVALRHEVITVLEEQTRTGSPAMKSRGRKLLRKLVGSSFDEAR